MMLGGFKTMNLHEAPTTSKTN